MTATCYITFGQKHRTFPHPVDERAHPDGWFEYAADTYDEAVCGASYHLKGEYACSYPVPQETSWYPRGCLARYTVTGPQVTEVTPDGGGDQ